MSTQKDQKAADSRNMPDPSRETVVVGAKQLRKAFKNGRAQRVYLAKNADPALTEPLAALCNEHQIPFTWVKSMIDLGRACGIEVGAATATVVE